MRLLGVAARERVTRLAGVTIFALSLTAMAGAASAEIDPETAERLRVIEARLAEQERRLAEQERLIAEQRLALQGLQQAREILLGELDDLRAGQSPAGANPNAAFQVAQGQPQGQAQLPTGPVGEAPPPPQIQEQETAALPERAGVLTPRGVFVLEPSFEYVRSSSNRLVFRGIEIVPGINFGLIEANEADRDTLVGNISARTGLTNRLEVEGRIGYVYRKDRIMSVQQRDEQFTRVRKLEGQDIGDLELGLRYQLNDGGRGRPIFVGVGRVKIPTGKGPFDVRYDDGGIARELATGSGFYGIEVGATMLYPTDPGVIFGGLSYIYNKPDDIGKEIGGAMVNEVDPGDAIALSMGYGLSLNPRFSASFGYSHAYIFPTRTMINNVDARSIELHVGSLLLGWSFRLTPDITISNNFEFGVTKDAPDMRWVLRVPYRF